MAQQSNNLMPKALVYLDCGRLHTAKMLSVGSRNCKIETQDGTLRKISLQKKLLTIPLDQAKETVGKADKLASKLNMAKAWKAVPKKGLNTAQMAQQIFPSEDQQIARLAVHVAHARERAFFSLDNDTWTPVSQAQYEAVIASIAKRKECQDLEQQWERQLAAGTMPDQLGSWLQKYLHTQPDPNAKEIRFIKRYCKKKCTDFGQLLVDHNLVRDLEQLHLRDCLIQIKPEAVLSQLPESISTKLPDHAMAAFSIDASGTQEVDDAFSVTTNDDVATIGIHIAVPGLGLEANAFAQAQDRMVSVYLVRKKFTMLPAAAYQHYSLDAGKVCPCLSLIVQFNTKQRKIIAQNFELGKINVEANLSLEKFADRDLNLPDTPEPLGRQLEMLRVFADHLSGGLKVRADPGYQISVCNGEPIVHQRSKSALVDALVEFLMRHYNTQAAKYLQHNGTACLLRNKGRLLVNQGNKKNSYGWFTSPLRRIVDLYNQHQLLGQLAARKPQHNQESLRALIPVFDRKHSWARSQQRKLEIYWSLRWLAMRKGQLFIGTVKTDKQVKLHDVPVTVNIERTNLAIGTSVKTKCQRIDLYRLDAYAMLV